MSAPSPDREPALGATSNGDPEGAAGLGPRRRFWESEGVPAWLSSLVLHTALLILLMLWQLSPRPSGVRLTLSQSGPADARPPIIDRIVLPQDPGQAAAPAETPAAIEIPPALQSITAPALAAPSLDLATDPSLTRPELGSLTSLLSTAASPAGAEYLQPLPSGGIAPRNAASRAELGALYGATPQSENAVELALAWLAEHQQRDGSWSFDLNIEPCRGRCSHSRSAGDHATPATAATGLALLAFLGAGYTHREGEYAETVRRGIYYLRDEARPAQFGLDLQAGSMYGHGIAALALTEVLAIDRYNGHQDADLRELVEGAILFTTVAQHTQGGWRYVPGSPGDMTVSGWQILSLVSARYGGIPLRTTTLPKAKEFLLSLSNERSYTFGYTSKRPQPTTTAIGLCMLMYLGESPHYTPYAHALEVMAAKGPKRVDVYHDYYATMALHNARHRSWEQWHVPLRDHLVRTQATSGHERGSWHFPDRHGDVGGRLYTTAMAALILEVYYRHLPLYQNRDEFRLR